MIPKQFEDIEASDIQSLIDDGRREDKEIEYKESLPIKSKEGRTEFLADVSSFANASGGDILYGISECRESVGSKGLPERVVGIGDLDPDQEIRRLESVVRDGIEPRIPGFRVRSIDGHDGGSVLLLRIERSWASPHMVRGGPRFFTRTSAGKHPLDISEVKAAFLQSEALSEDIRRFRADRLGKIIAAEVPVPLSPSATIVLHIVPVATFRDRKMIDMTPFFRGDIPLPTIWSVGSHGRLNVDGFVASSSYGSQREFAVDYVQFFRDGAIESVDVKLLEPRSEGNLTIPSISMEDQIIKSAKAYFEAYRVVGIAGPVVVMLSLLNAKGYYILYDVGQTKYDPVDRPHLLLPDVIVEDLACNVATSLRPMFDLLWQACGLPRSRNYDEDGNRKTH